MNIDFLHSWLDQQECSCQCSVWADDTERAGARCAPQGVQLAPVRTPCSRPLFYGRRNFFLLRIKLRLACYFFSSIPLRRFEASLDRIPMESGLQVCRFSAYAGYPAPSRYISVIRSGTITRGFAFESACSQQQAGDRRCLVWLMQRGFIFLGREFSRMAVLPAPSGIRLRKMQAVS